MKIIRLLEYDQQGSSCQYIANQYLINVVKFSKLFRWMKMAMGALTLRSFLQWCRIRYIAAFHSYQTNVYLCGKCCFVGQMLFCGTICDSQFMVWRKLNFSWRWRKMRSMRTFGRRSESLIGMETGIFMFEIW